MTEQLGEPLEARIPEAFVAAEPVIGALERARIDPAVMDASAYGAFHEAGPLEGLDVLRRRGQRHSVRRGELAYGLLAFGQPLEHGAPGVVAERTEDEVESQLSMFNHMVEYTGHGMIVNPFVECSPECCAPRGRAPYLTRLLVLSSSRARHFCLDRVAPPT